jgi:hypothetical protein
MSRLSGGINPAKPRYQGLRKIKLEMQRMDEELSAPCEQAQSFDPSSKLCHR